MPTPGKSFFIKSTTNEFRELALKTPFSGILVENKDDWEGWKIRDSLLALFLGSSYRFLVLLG